MKYILLFLLLTSCGTTTSRLDFNGVLCYPIDTESGVCTANFRIVEK